MLKKKDLSPVVTTSNLQVQYSHIDFDRDSVWFGRHSELGSEVKRTAFIQRAKYYHNIPGWPDADQLGP